MATMSFAESWPLILVALAVFIIIAGLLRKIAKAAFVGIALAAIGLFLWQAVGTAG